MLRAAKTFAESYGGPACGMTFIEMRNGYRAFDPMRGMDYMIDLKYRNSDDEVLFHRIHLNRPIVHTQLMHQVQGVDYCSVFMAVNHLLSFFNYLRTMLKCLVKTACCIQVPYVKEDTDLTIVVPVGSMAEVTPARRLLARHARLCQTYAGDPRQTRVVVAVRSITAVASRLINNDLVELKNRFITN